MPDDVTIVLTGDGLEAWQASLAAVDAAGFWGLGIGDSPSLYHDVYVRCAIAAQATRSVRIGPWVTNPLTRHPAVTASAIASVDELSGGRAVLGIGTGDSAVLNLGLQPSTMAGLEAYVRAVRRLLEHGEAEWEGRVARLTFAKRRVPIYLAASGPRTVRLAGRIADGVIVASGILPEVVQATLAELRAGAEEAGRDVAEIDVWWAVMANLADDGTALDEIKGSLVTRAHHAFRAGTTGKHLPPALAPAMQRIQAEYQPIKHTQFGQGHHAQLADDLGLTPYLASRFSICGGPGRFVQRVHEARAAGARRLALHVRVADKRRFLRLWTSAVRPSLG